MKKFTERKTFCFTKEQIKTFDKLESKHIDISNFVRNAIKEKIERDFPKKVVLKKRICPFSGQEY